MKKLLLLTKTLLAAALLCVGQNAWGDTYEILYGTAVYTDAVVTGVNPQTDFSGDTNEATGITWTDGNGNSGYTIDGSVLLANTTGAWTKYFTNPVASGKVYYAANYTGTANGTSNVFQIVDSKGYAIYKSVETLGTNKGSAKNETKKVATICGTEISSYIRLSKDATYSVKSLCIDLDNKQVTYELWTSSNTTGGSTTSGTIALPDNVTDVQGLSVLKANQNCYLDNVLLYSQLPAGTKYTHTVNAVNSSDEKLATVAFHAVYADTETGAAETLYYSKGVNYNGTWYLTPNASETYYGYAFAGATETKKITYTANNDIVYFQEAENMTSSGSFNGCSQYNRYSGGAARRHQGKAYLYTSALPAGKYDVTVGGREEQNKADQTLTISVLSSDKTTWTAAGTVGTWGKADVSEKTLENVTVGEGEYIVIDNHNSNYSTNVASDYIYLKKSKVAYTVKYKCGSVEIKDADASRTAAWGTHITLTDGDKASIIYEGDIYTYSSDDASTTEIAVDGSSIITVTFSKVPFYTLADVTEAATWDWSVVTSETGYSQLTAETTPTNSAAFIMKNLELYGKQDGTSYSIPVGFGDAQQLEVIAQYPFRYNSSKGMFQGNSVKFHTTVPGTVQVKFSNTGGNADRPYRHVSVNGTLSAEGSANGTELTSEAFVVQAGDVTITGYIPDASNPAAREGDNVGATMLRIYSITFTPVTSVSATIGSTGWTTFASPYALNLSSMTASTGEVTAFYASAIADGKVTMTSTESDAVAAGTGIMLKGTAGATITIPVAASAGTAISGNKLIGCTTETNLDTNSNYYVLVNNGGTAEFQCLDKNGATIPAGKAYLNAAGAARALRIVFDDITGVANVEAAAEAKAKEGKFIENGKLVIVKNGVKFNAAGAKLY